MAKTASRTSTKGSGTTRKGSSGTKASSTSAGGGRSGKRSTSGAKANQGETTAADALIKLIESPLVADLLAVGATAALAAIAESRYSRREDDQRRAARTLKAAATAAAAAMGRRLATEVEEIQKAAKKARAGEAA